MHITIEINTVEASPQDLAVLAAITGVPVATVEAAPAAPAAKATPAPAAKKAAAKPAPEPEPVDEPDEDLVGDSDDIVYSLTDAKDLATKLVSEGKAKEVKAQLEVHGVKRVSELADDDIAAFITALS